MLQVVGLHRGERAREQPPAAPKEGTTSGDIHEDKMRSSGKKGAARCSGAASHRLVGVLLLAGATAATARRATAPAVTPAVPELMESVRPAQTARALHRRLLSLL